LIELMIAMAIACTVTAVAIPSGLRIADDDRASAAARLLAHRLHSARMDAIRRSTSIGFRFDAAGDDCAFTPAADGNGDGLHAADIADGTDPSLGPAERLGTSFPGVVFGILPGVPDANGEPIDGPDGVRLGPGRILSMSPNGSATSGTLYLHGRRGAQYAVRVLGATGRIRLLKYVESAGRWVDR
jgi:type II secretory pathway pseudopilin PulG